MNTNRFEGTEVLVNALANNGITVDGVSEEVLDDCAFCFYDYEDGDWYWSREEYERRVSRA